ncbi:hypothetical protein LLH00_03565 [bacterium]|nr:hypothetical protein [bacterium]
MSKAETKRPWPDILDRVLEVMRHFYCQSPEELESMLALAPDSLSGAFRRREPSLAPEVLDSLVRSGVRAEYILRGEIPMLQEHIDRGSLDTLYRFSARLLVLLAESEAALHSCAPARTPTRRTTDNQGEPVSLDEQLASLLAEALRDRKLRERLLEFIRKEASNRHSRRG